MEYDPNAPAFPNGEVEPIEEVVTDPIATEEVETEEVPAESEEESKVPYSRFKKFHDEAKYYEEQARIWQERATTYNQPSHETQTVDVPQYWTKLYGDSPESIEAWKIQSEQNEQLKREAREEAIKAVQEQSQYEEVRTQENLETIDSNLDALTDYVGRAITEKEQSAVLDIVDDYTPKDENGNYAGALLPFEKAWEIYEMKTQSSKAPNSRSRDSVAALSGTQSQGDASGAEQDKNFNPLDWGAYKRRI